LVAASLLLLLVPLTWRVLATLHHQRNILACQNNLRMFHEGLVAYSDHQPDHALPKVEANPPYNIAGIFVPILYQGGYLQPEVSVTCPENGCRHPEPVSLETLAAEQATQPDQFERDAHRLAGCYAYGLGYRDALGRHCGLRCDPSQPNNDWIPIMADRPPFEQWDKVLNGNSLNHGGEGQNVLFLGGHVEFFKSRNVGIDGDDIYLNRNQLIEAGLDRFDAVLGASGFRPYP
jgi:prepilin-type processing-associated H-X9-DG protein